MFECAGKMPIKMMIWQDRTSAERERKFHNVYGRILFLISEDACFQEHEYKIKALWPENNDGQINLWYQAFYSGSDRPATDIMPVSIRLWVH